MSDQKTSAPSLLDTVVFGYMPAQVIHVAARLGIADHLASGAMTSAELAALTETHAPSMHRLLRSLACLGVVAEIEPDRFTLEPAGAPLQTEAPDSIRALVMLFCSDAAWRSWGELEYSVRTGQPAWERVTGMTPFEYFAQHPDQAATFNAAMADHTRAVAPTILAGYDFSRFGTLVDVGGGDGTLIAAILNASPAMRGVLFDLPAGVEAAARTLEAAGVTDRCRVVTGDFFASVPEGADAYLLKSVIHDWDDERAVAILRSCYRAMPTTGTVLVVESVLPLRAESPETTGTVMSDINMLVSTGGRERTEDQFRALFAAASLELTKIIGVGADYHVIEGSPV
ncbi:MAG: methyltransferase [Pseudonocardiaceae bacterium]